MHHSFSFSAPDGVLTWLVSTHFEPTGARAAFPCFDDIGMKASYTITLSTSDPSGIYTFLSNMPVTSRTVIGTDVTVAFAPTPVISSYLVAFVIGQLETSTIVRNGSFYIYTPFRSVIAFPLSLTS